MIYQYYYYSNDENLIIPLFLRNIINSNHNCVNHTQYKSVPFMFCNVDDIYLPVMPIHMLSTSALSVSLYSMYLHKK